VTAPARVLIVGTGLLGTSLGLALNRADVGVEVWLSDLDPRRAALAGDLGAGRVGAPESGPDVAVVAVPPRATPMVALTLLRLYPHCSVSDMASVKSQPQAVIDGHLDVRARFVGGHPMAGRERSGPEGARADLFAGQPWVVAPGSFVGAVHLDRVLELVRLTGAEPVVMSAGRHDEAVAVVSHVPQVVASAVAAGLVSATPSALDLAGPGVRDVTRIAASDPQLWLEIVTANAGPVAVGLSEVVDRLTRVRDALSELAANPDSSTGTFTDISTDRDIHERSESELRALLVAGNRGRALLPGKHGAAAVEYAVVPVVIPDEPGALARLFVAAGEAGVNIEDVSIEHVPGQPVGLVELSVRPDQAVELTDALQRGGWRVH